MSEPAERRLRETTAQRLSDWRMYWAIVALVFVWAGVLILRTPIQARYWAWQLARSGEPAAQRYYFGRLASLADRCVPAVARLLDSDRADVRNTGAMLLHYARTDESRALLLRCLSDQDAEVRRTAAMGLALDDSPEVLDVLRANLSDADESTAALAAAALGRMGGDRALAALLSALRQETRLSVKAEIIDGLGQIRSTDAVRLLVEALSDDRPLFEPTSSDRLAIRALEAVSTRLAEAHPASEPATLALQTPATVSELAARSLRLITRRSFGFDSTLPDERKAAVIEQWRAAATATQE